EIGALYDHWHRHPGLSPRLRARLVDANRAEIIAAAKGLPTLLKRELQRRSLSRPPVVVPEAERAAPEPAWPPLTPSSGSPVPDVPPVAAPVPEPEPDPAPTPRPRRRLSLRPLLPLRALRLLLTLLAVARESVFEGAAVSLAWLRSTGQGGVDALARSRR